MASPTLPADLIEEALLRVWTEAHREYGPDENQWTPAQMRNYLIDLDAARLDPGWVITT